MKLKFTKMHGCGNDYIYVNGFSQHIDADNKPELVRRLSDRHFGIGGDGVWPSWIIPLTVWLGFIVLVAATRYVSLGSCWGGASFIVVSWLVYRDPLILLLAAVMGGLLLWGHRGNMVRLVKGTERRFSFCRKEAAPEPKAEERPEAEGEPAPEAESEKNGEK